MTKHRAVVTGYDPTYENPDGSTGRPKGVQTAADMRVATSFDVLAEGIFALHGIPSVVKSPVNTIQITPFMAAIESPNGGYYVIKITENETVELNLTLTGNVKVYVQQEDWELENDVADADSRVVFGAVYGANPIPEGALLLFTSTLSGQTSTSGMTFTPAFKYTGPASGVIRVPTKASLDLISSITVGLRGLVTSGSAKGEYFYGEDSVWHSSTTPNPKLESAMSTNFENDGSIKDGIIKAADIDPTSFLYEIYQNPSTINAPGEFGWTTAKTFDISSLPVGAIFHVDAGFSLYDGGGSSRTVSVQIVYNGISKMARQLAPYHINAQTSIKHRKIAGQNSVTVQVGGTNSIGAGGLIATIARVG